MYSLQAIEMFIEDHPDLLGISADEILERARELARSNLVSAHDLIVVFGDGFTAQEFKRAAATEGYAQATTRALRSAQSATPQSGTR